MHEETFYAVYEDGSTGTLTVTAQDGAGLAPPVLTRPGRLVSEKQYETALRKLRTSHQEHVAALLAEDAARQSREYRDLRAAGIAEATARRLSGWEGEEQDS